MKIVMGDINSNVGNDNTSYEREVGKKGFGIKNNSGERCLSAV